LGEATTRTSARLSSEVRQLVYEGTLAADGDWPSVAPLKNNSKLAFPAVADASQNGSEGATRTVVRRASDRRPLMCPVSGERTLRRPLGDP
jgi:hypothetical protein